MCMFYLSDTDECLVSTVCEQDCHNLLGSYTCSCREGYNLQSDQRSCTGSVFVDNQ